MSLYLKLLYKIIEFLKCIKILAIFKIHYLILRVDTQSLTVGIGKLFLIGPHGRYFRLVDHTDTVASTQLYHHSSKVGIEKYIDKFVWPCSSKTIKTDDQFVGPWFADC